MSNTVTSQSQLDTSSSIPLYRQLASAIKQGIQAGEYKHDSQIPTEAVLSQKYGISRITVRKALDELTDEGLLIRKQGKGTFVYAEKNIHTDYPFMPFADAVHKAGKTPSTKLVSYSMELPSRRIASFLGLDEHENVISLKRLRMADDTPIMLETNYFPSSFDFLASEALTGSTSEILTNHNILPVHGTTTISICYATEEEALLLNIEADSSLLYVYSEIKDQNQRAVQVSKQIIRSEFYKLTLSN